MIKHERKRERERERERERKREREMLYKNKDKFYNILRNNIITILPIKFHIY